MLNMRVVISIPITQGHKEFSYICLTVLKILEPIIWQYRTRDGEEEVPVLPHEIFGPVYWPV
jgi:hypothetical protein